MTLRLDIELTENGVFSVVAALAGAHQVIGVLGLYRRLTARRAGGTV